jgi:hypothetical protein
MGSNKESINMKEKTCVYPLCVNFDPKAKNYCCNGCAYDHYDYIELHEKEKQDPKKV